MEHCINELVDRSVVTMHMIKFHIVSLILKNQTLYRKTVIRHLRRVTIKSILLYINNWMCYKTMTSEISLSRGRMTSTLSYRMTYTLKLHCRIIHTTNYIHFSTPAIIFYINSYFSFHLYTFLHSIYSCISF